MENRAAPDQMDLSEASLSRSTLCSKEEISRINSTSVKINVSTCLITWLFLSENTLTYAVLSNIYCLLIYLSSNNLFTSTKVTVVSHIMR